MENANEQQFRFRASIHIDYQNIIKNGITGTIGEQLGQWVTSRQSVIIVTDDGVPAEHCDAVQASLRAAGWHQVPVVRFRNGEPSKSLDTYQLLIDQLINVCADRKTVLLALGGGIVSDTVGFVAATFMRGLDYVVIPTTLMGQLDASVGGKVAVNHKSGKNLIGAFWHPLGVIIDPELLATLPDTEIRNGLSEAVKVAVINSPLLFEFIEEHADELVSAEPSTLEFVIKEAVGIKLELLLPDPFESDLRRELNFGHTFAHVLETMKSYHLRHGYAVSIGMCIATRVAVNRNLIEATEAKRIFQVLERLGLPVSPPTLDPHEVWDQSRIIQCIRGNKLRFVMPRFIGNVTIVDDLSEDEFVNAYDTTMAATSNASSRTHHASYPAP